jgi:hypothetical protein
MDILIISLYTLCVVWVVDEVITVCVEGGCKVYNQGNGSFVGFDSTINILSLFYVDHGPNIYKDT